MGRQWSSVPISCVAARVRRPEIVDDTKMYRLLGARLYGKGLYLKDEKPGTAIRATKLYAVRAGDLVYNRLFAWKGSFAIAQPEHEGCFVSNEFPCFELDTDRVSPRFLWLYFTRDRVWREALALSTGSTPASRNRLKEARFLSMEVPLPALEEQRRVVARVEELGALIREAQDLRAKARQQAESIMHAALVRVFATPAKKAWGLQKLHQAADTATGGTPSRSRDEYFGGDIPWVKSAELRDTIIESTEERLTSAGLANSSAKVFPIGTILVAMYGANVGKTGILGLPAATNQAVCAVFPREEKLDNRFVYYFFRWKRPELLASSFGGAQPNISQKVIKALEVAFPRQLEEQTRIVAYLDALQAKVDQLTAFQGATQPDLGALLLAVLDKAFSGGL